MRIMAKNHTATKEQRQAGAWRKRGTKSVGGGMLALTSAVVAAAMLATPAALAGEGTARYYSSKQPYVAPASTSYSAIPSRYHLAYTESVARHGSRGLSSYKYDALLALMAQSAAENNYAGFVSPEVGKEFINNVNAITAVNVGNGMACSLVRAPYSTRALVREYTSVMLICSPMPQSRDCASHTRAQVSLVQPNPERISN